ncbi:MAG: GH25 family lysozyme [Vicinamibacterales bacterium]
MVVLDLSNHDYSTFDPACLARTVERVIVNCWDRGITRDIVLRSRAYGIDAEDLYCYLYFGQQWEQREVENAVALIADIGGIKRVWLDVEADPPNEIVGMTTAGRVAAIDRALATLPTSVQPGIYTYGPYWVGQMNSSVRYRHLPLWYANYGTNDPKAPRGPIQAVNFGGWSAVSVHQYSSTIEVCGRGRDHNYWFIPEGEVGMSDDDLLAIFAGGEEKGPDGNLLDRDERLRRARFRRDEAAAGRAPSVRELAARASGATVPDHIHHAGEVIR